MLITIESPFLFFAIHTFDNVFEVNGVLELFHVHVVGRDVQDGGDRLCQLDREHLGLRAQLVGGIETARVAGKVVLVSSIQCNVQSGTVVILQEKARENQLILFYSKYMR